MPLESAALPNTHPSDVPFDELVQEHLMKCRAFILDWSTRSNKPSDREILWQVKRVEHIIRKRWWALYVANEPEGRTFSSCIEKAKLFADQQWTQDFVGVFASTKDSQPGPGSGRETGKQG